MASVTLINLSKTYDNRITAVKNVDLSIKDQEFVVLVGPSGCGKSTLLRMIAGLESITEGQILIDDIEVNHVLPKNRDIAMVFQNYALYPHMSVFENMAFGLKLRKYPKDEIITRVNEAAEILHIKECLDRKPKALSGGQRQRVALGRALVRKPKVFLFDEPLSNLDAKLRVQMRVELKRLYNTLRTTMIYVTHDQVEAMTMGNKIVVLRDGVIQQVDDPIQIYNNPKNKFVASFIGSPAMNFFYGKLLINNSLKFKSSLFEINLPMVQQAQLNRYINKQIILGIRPEDISDSHHAMSGGKSDRQEIIIDVVEPVGNETFLYFKEEDKSYCMRVSTERTYLPGEKLNIFLNPKKIHFFDLKTQQRLN